MGKKGDGLGSFLLKFGEMVKQRNERLMMIGFSVQNTVCFQKMSLATYMRAVRDCLKAVNA